MKNVLFALMLAMSTSAFADNCGNDKPVGNADCDKPKPKPTPAPEPNTVPPGWSVTGGVQTFTPTVTSSGGAGGTSSSSSSSKATGGEGGKATSNATGGASSSTSSGGSASSSVGATTATSNNSGGNLSNVGNSSIADGAVSNANSYSNSYSNTSTFNEAAQTAYAPALTSGVDTCMGSSSIGGQGVGFGFSMGTTWNDDNCVLLKNSRQMYNMGQKEIALAMMCKNEDVKKAAEAAGSSLCSTKKAAAASNANVEPVAKGADLSDPFIVARLKKMKIDK